MSENYHNCLIETDYYEIVLMRNINSCKRFKICMAVVPHILFKYFKYYDYEVDDFFLSKLTQINNKHLLTF